VISFIVPAYNEEKYLPATLASIKEAAAALGPFELIVADDDSSDATASLAAAAGARVVRSGKRRISATRNVGAAAAQGDLLFFIDADTLVSPALVADAVRALRSGAVGGGAGARFDGRMPAYAFVLDKLLHLYARTAKKAFGCFVFCRRADFEAVGGFDSRYYAGEEWVLSTALGKRGRFVMLKGSVLTSGRKLRTHSAWEILKVFGGFALRGWGSLRKPRGTELWYGPRREDAP
jgi:glycosyltransferase involved in cell wall biosynthesis